MLSGRAPVMTPPAKQAAAAAAAAADAPVNGAASGADGAAVGAGGAAYVPDSIVGNVAATVEPIAAAAAAEQNGTHVLDASEDVAAAQRDLAMADDEAMAYAMAYEELSD